MVSGLSNTEILTDSKFQGEPNIESTISDYILRLKKQEPIQYILGKAHFYDNIFEVNESTLIPRPETEELVELVLKLIEEKNSPRVLDIGVGSGCIATTIALNSVKAKVHGCDISDSALAIAKRNIKNLGADVELFQADIFSYETMNKFDVIVSNPPYVRESEKEFMARNVLEHEPLKALFVPDDDPLRFYYQITKFSKNSLTPDGALCFEVNEVFANDVAEILKASEFYKIIIAKDINGKDRFVYGLQS